MQCKIQQSIICTTPKLITIEQVVLDYSKEMNPIYILVFAMAENNSQIKNIFSLTKKKKKIFSFQTIVSIYKFCKPFFEFEYFFLKSPYCDQTTTRPPSNHPWC